MDTVFTLTFMTGLFAATLRMATPLIFATVGELFHEKVGVLNLGIEGTMLLGGLVGFLVTWYSGSLWLGVFCAGLSGCVLSALMALLSVTFGLNQLVSGLGITFLGTGLAHYLYRLCIGNPTVPPAIEPFAPLDIGGLGDVAFLGPVFFNQNILVYLALAVAVLATLFFARTVWGLRIRSIGENPAAADTMGVNVNRTRYLSMIFGGFLMGVAGAYLSLAHFNMFIFGLVSGRGFISIALVIFGAWNPARCMLGALLFGMIDALQFRLQTLGFDVPYQFFLIMPYALTIVALIIVARKASTPAALATPYNREE